MNLPGLPAETSSVDEISQNLIDLALHHETDDNASVVVFHLHKLIPNLSEAKIHTEKTASWFQKLRKLVP